MDSIPGTWAQLQRIIELLERMVPQPCPDCGEDPLGGNDKYLCQHCRGLRRRAEAEALSKVHEMIATQGG